MYRKKKQTFFVIVRYNGVLCYCSLVSPILTDAHVCILFQKHIGDIGPGEDGIITLSHLSH